MMRLPANFKKIIIFSILAAFLSLALTLFIVEKIIKFAYPQLTFSEAKRVSLNVSAKSDYLPSQLMPNQKTIHIGNTHEFKNSVSINSLGFRMEEFSKEKPQNEFRILMLGDSMIFGYGVEEKDNLPSNLKQKLNNYLESKGITDKKIQIINAGFADWRSPDSYYLFLKKEGLKLNPDLIVVNYFLNNDIADLDETVWVKTDSLGLPEKIDSKISYVDNGQTRFKRQYQDWKYSIPILKDSHLWILFATAIEARSPKTVSKIKNILGLAKKLPIVDNQENYMCLFKNECSEKMNKLYEEFFKIVLATNHLAKNNNVPIIVGLLPSNPQVKEIVINSPKQEECNPEKITGCYPQKKIEEFLKENNIEYIDPLVSMITGDSDKYYFEKDGHATVEGNEKFAQSYFDYLTTTNPNLLPQQ